MTALEAWLLYVALVGWGMFGFMCWFAWTLAFSNRLRESMRGGGK